MTLKEAIPLAQPRWRELSEERKKVCVLALLSGLKKLTPLQGLF
jgi:hypothetical protein